MHVLTVVCGTGSLLLGAAGATGIDNSSGISPLLSKTLESETRRSVSFSPRTRGRSGTNTVRSRYLGYVGPQSTSQQFLIMFLWLYGFWTRFFPDQDPLIWSKQKGHNSQHWDDKLYKEPNPGLVTVLFRKDSHFALYLIQKHSSIFRCYSHRHGCDLLRMLSEIH